MNSEDFLNWMSLNGIASAAGVHRALGMGINQAGELVRKARAGEEVPVSRSVALAMTAYSVGLKMWGSQ